jgi:hypothetical protein
MVREMPAEEPRHKLVDRQASPHSVSAAGILSLPRKIRDRIYQTVLYISQPIYLFQDSGPLVEIFTPGRPRRWLALLQVNRQIHDEAAEVLFGINHFTLLDERQPQDRLLGAFLTCIGPVNSAWISRLSMDFPALTSSTGGVKLKDDSLQRLKLLQNHCTHLTTLEFSFSVKHIKDLSLLTGDSPQVQAEALSLIDSQLQTIPSLKTIIIRITGPEPVSSTVHCMQSLGWTTLLIHE